MRVIAGKWKRRTIPSPPGKQTRPTTDFLRESVFHTLEQAIELNGAIVLDLFAGSGAFSWESLSRGASKAVMVDTSPAICAHLRAFSVELGVEQAVQIAKADAIEFMQNSTLPQLNIVFADPPYGLLVANQVLRACLRQPAVSIGCILVIEHGTGEFLLDDPHFETLRRIERSGSIATVMRRVSPLP